MTHPSEQSTREEREPEGFYIIPNRDSPDQDSLWDGTIHPTRESAQASLDEAREDWGQYGDRFHIVKLIPVDREDRQ